MVFFMIFSQASMAGAFKNLKWVTPGKYVFSMEYKGRSDMNFQETLDFCHGTKAPLEERAGCSIKILLDTPQKGISHVRCNIDGQTIEDQQEFISAPPVFTALGKLKMSGELTESKAVLRRVGDCR